MNMEVSVDAMLEAEPLDLFRVPLHERTLERCRSTVRCNPWAMMFVPVAMRKDVSAASMTEDNAKAFLDWAINKINPVEPDLVELMIQKHPAIAEELLSGGELADLLVSTGWRLPLEAILRQAQLSAVDTNDVASRPRHRL